MPIREPAEPSRIEGKMPESMDSAKYKTLGGIRFHKDIPDTVAASIVTKMTEAETRLQQPDASMRGDPRALLEHMLVAGTAPEIRDPLVPYAIFTKTKDVAEVSRQRQGMRSFLVGMYEPGSSTSIELAMDDTTRKAFDAFLQEKGWQKLAVVYDTIELDEGSGKIRMPKIKSFLSPERTPLPESLADKDIRLKKQKVSVTSLLSQDEGIIAYIDKNGWVFEKTNNS
ncbi:MAG TPA: hypothetical protein VJH63_01555 [Candidatus Paceibacterota bacterium]